MFFFRLSLFLWFSLVACGPSSNPEDVQRTTPASKAEIAPTAPANDGPLHALTYRKTEDWMERQGFRAKGHGTGPGPLEFSGDWSHPEDKAVEVNLLVVSNPGFRTLLIEDIPADALRHEEGDAILTVKCVIGETASNECSRGILDGLMERAADPAKPYALVATPAQSWLLPTTEIRNGSHLAISRALTDKTIAGLDSLGYSGGRILTEQQVNITKGTDSGFPHVSVTAQKEQTSAKVQLFCVRSDTDKHFWPTPALARLGEAILIHEYCSIRVHVGTQPGRRSDQAAAETLLRGLLAFTPAH